MADGDMEHFLSRKGVLTEQPTLQMSLQKNDLIT